MTHQPLVPLLFEPQLRHYVWGGRNLETLYGRGLPPGLTAESWEISGHAATPTRVSGGPFQGQTLAELIETLGNDLLGSRGAALANPGRFPLLVKLLDAQRSLSVQVHPDDAYAARHAPAEGGKVECWYILAAADDARIVYGLRPGVDRAAMVAAIEAGHVEDVLGLIPVKAGDCVFVPAGTVHALLEGTVVAEVQQTSDATYRIYDWGRLGDDGKPRELHIERALEVIRWDAQGPGVVSPRLLEAGEGLRRSELVRCPQFILEKVELGPGATYRGECEGETFEIWGCMEGSVALAPHAVGLEAIRFVLLPARMGEFSISAETNATLLRAYLGPED